MSNGSEMYCNLEGDTVYSRRYGPRESSCVNLLCRTAVKLEAVGLTRVYRITPFDRSNFFLAFERSQCMKQIKVKNILYSKREKKKYYLPLSVPSVISFIYIAIFSVFIQVLF